MGADVRDVCEKDTNNSDVVFGESFGEAKQPSISTVYLMNHIFQTSVLECIEVN